ncbi:LysR family transcriptional regulator [Bacillus sp. X1(2014)]|uniref:LysR family transcriptional regulator n=1 Tax=Bacillus sp. X1(2014) TaxID=1565991 RepID=UPI0011A40CD5|nr:LysR family transcriptional regulator [Bacillus sp. X1(2014)]
MTVFQYEVFLKVVDTGNFTKAGENLGLTQSGVSHNISALESELGIILLNRGRNGVSLTDAGKRMIGHMRNIVSESEQIKQKTAAILGIELGKVKIGSFPSASAKLLPGVISYFKSRYEGIELELYEGSYDKITEWVESGVVDIGFVSLPVKRLETIPLLKDKLVVLVPSGHPFHEHKSLTIEELSQVPFILPKAGCEVLIKERFQSKGLKPNIQFEIEDNQTIISMVLEGLGLTVVPRLTLPNWLTQISTVELVPETYRSIGLAVKSIKDCTPAVKEFIIASQKFVEINSGNSL